MRDITANLITRNVAKACIAAACDLPEDVLDALKNAKACEESPLGQEVLDQLVENAALPSSEQMPICQDTGLALVFVELGQDAHIVGGDIYQAVNEGVRRGYEEGYLRKSIVRHPLDRVNTNDNTPAVVHVEIVPGDRVRITIAPKGGGSENMSIARVLAPAEGLEGLKQLVVETVVSAGSNPCPPVIVGIGLGGSLEKAAILSKKAILRKTGEPSRNPIDAKIEAESACGCQQNRCRAGGPRRASHGARGPRGVISLPHREPPGRYHPPVSRGTAQEL